MKIWIHHIKSFKEENDEILLNCSPYFYNRYNSFRFKEDRIRRFKAYLMLRNAIIDSGCSSDLLNEIRLTTNKKPYIENWCNFNISYSNNFVVLVTSPISNVGIDVEYIKSFNVDHALYLFHPSERKYIMGKQNSEKMKSFYEVWTKKEALVKAMGVGINNCKFHTLNCLNNDIFLKEKWFLKEIRLKDNYMCYVACNTDHDKIEVIKVSNNMIQ